MHIFHDRQTFWWTIACAYIITSLNMISRDGEETPSPDVTGVGWLAKASTLYPLTVLPIPERATPRLTVSGEGSMFDC